MEKAAWQLLVGGVCMAIALFACGGKEVSELIGAGGAQVPARVH